MSDKPLPIATPVHKEPTVSKAPPAGRKFPCPACGARLDFDPAARGLSCPYCGHREKIAKDADAEVLERDYHEYLDRQEESGGGKAIEGRSSQVRCTGCGAMVLLEDKVATEKCPFCHTHLENHPESAAGAVPPESLLPFKVELKAARDAFTQWLEGLWFAPTELKKIANLGQLTGVYLPYWTYDSMTYTVYDGLRGDDYQETEWFTATKPDGTTEQQSRTVTKTRWTPVSGEVQHFFDDVLVCASKSLPPAMVADLEPWHLEKLEPFQASYLSGFKTERYAIGLKEGFGRAKEFMEPEIHRLICQDIGGNHQQVRGKKTKYSSITFKHLLLPMWVAVYRYREDTYQVLLNGRSAKVVGKRPWSFMKIFRLVSLIVLALALVAVLVAKFAK
jgi:DNA-directed RNA polymerase subunit RPC12/RpoP